MCCQGWFSCLALFKINGVQVIKSGTDFREFSCITVSFNTDNSFTLDVQRIEITSDIPEDPEVKSTVDKYVGELKCFNFHWRNFICLWGQVMEHIGLRAKSTCCGLLGMVYLWTSRIFLRSGKRTYWDRINIMCRNCTAAVETTHFWLCLHLAESTYTN